MKNVFDYKNFKINESTDISDMYIIADLYDKEQKTTFFKEFIEIYPTRKDFSKELKKYYKYGKDDDYEEFDIDREEKTYWTPEIEEEMLEKEIMADYPGYKAWSNFINDLLDTEWNEK